MKFEFNYQGKEIKLNVKVCDNTFSRACGLMFKNNSKPLLFIFPKLTRQLIHSFFCKPFVAVWFDGSRIIDVKVIDKWRFCIKPVEKFDKLLEIPLHYQNCPKFWEDKA